MKSTWNTLPALASKELSLVPKGLFPGQCSWWLRSKSAYCAQAICNHLCGDNLKQQLREGIMNFLVHVSEAPRSKLNYFQMSKHHLAGGFYLGKLFLILCFYDYD